MTLDVVVKHSSCFIRKTLLKVTKDGVPQQFFLNFFNFLIESINGMDIKFLGMLNYVGNQVIPAYRILVIHLFELPFPQSNFLVNFMDKSAITDEFVEFLSPCTEVMVIIVLSQIQLNVSEFSL